MTDSQTSPNTLDLQWNDVKLATRDFNLLSSFIQREVGIQLPPAKRILLESRLRKRLRVFKRWRYWRLKT